MRFSFSLGVLAACFLLVSAATAQQDDSDPSGKLSPQAWNKNLVLRGLTAGPYDVETAPFDNRCLGVQKMDRYYFVTGRGHTSTGDNPMIHRYTLTGTYIDSWPQVSNSTGWRGRDMEAIGWMLYVGSDSGEVSIYHWDPVMQTLAHQQIVTVTGMTGTVRALWILLPTRPAYRASTPSRSAARRRAARSPASAPSQGRRPRTCRAGGLVLQ